jgi:hypothetical protein
MRSRASSPKRPSDASNAGSSAIVDLQAAINRFLKETNDHPKPFVWTADPDKIIAALRRGCQTLDLVD